MGGLLFGRIYNPAAVSMGIYNPAISVVSHCKCLYSILADFKSARTKGAFHFPGRSPILSRTKSTAESQRPVKCLPVKSSSQETP